MPPVIEILPNQARVTKPLFSTQADYNRFREAFLAKTKDDLDRLQEARRKSEQAARQRLLK
jgi:hypothetical protein